MCQIYLNKNKFKIVLKELKARIPIELFLVS